MAKERDQRTMRLLKTKQVVVRIAIIIAFAELLIMLMIGTFHHELSIYSEAVLDVAVLIVFSAPLIHIWIIKPFVQDRDKAITQARQAALAMEETNQGLAEQLHATKELLEAIPLPVFFKNREGIYIGVNRAWELFFGIPRERIIGNKLSELYPEYPRIAKMHQGKDEELYRGQEMQFYEATIPAKDGAMRHTQYCKAIHTTADGTAVGLIGVINDITERKEAEAELTGYIQAVDQHALISVTDLAGRILQVNDMFCKISGYTRAELLGQNHRLLKSGMHSDTFYAELWATIVRGEIWRGEICNRAKDGALYWVDAAIVPVKDPDGRVERYISVRIDITARKQAEQHIIHLASHDALTGLPNRHLLQDRMQQALIQDRRHDSQHDRRHHGHAAVLFIDLDEFKSINDLLGHDVGDLLLKEAAARLVSCVRGEDTVARQGGDEFIVLLLNITNAQDAGIVGKKLLDTLALPYQIKGKELHISASIGIAVFPDDGEDVETLLKNSDIAMYHAKEAGRNNCQFFTPKLNQLTAEKQVMRTDLHQALSRNELLLHFQPIVDMANGQLAGLEVLLRWQHPTQGLIPPLKFIPLAEETGLIEPIGEWVLKSACRQWKAWQNQGYALPRLSINLSARQFRQPTLAENMARILDETGMEAGFIELEITESILMTNSEEVVETLRKLKAMGMEISIDDFGTGHSSLSYLKHFPIDTLKVDRSFVNDLATNADNAAIVTAIIALAHSLQLKVIAEGVEDAVQLAFLRRHGCDRYQGFYFSKPVPASEVVGILPRRQDSSVLTG